MRSFSNFVRVLVVSLLMGGTVLADDAKTVTWTKSITLQECIEQALSQNLEIEVERINPRIAEWGVVREQSGFEPAFNGRFNYMSNRTPLDPETARSVGFPLIDDRELKFGADVGGRLPTGTSYDLSAADTRYAGTLQPTNYLHIASTVLTLDQPLLRNFGFAPNTASVRVARKNRQIATEQFRQRVIDTVSAVIDAYYDLVRAIEDHKAQVEDLDRARTLLEQNRKEVDAGMLPPIEVTQAEAGVAEREEGVIVTEQGIRNQENALKRLISRDSLPLVDVSLVPVDHPEMEIVAVDAKESIRTALENRPDFLQAKHELERRGIMLKYMRNQLLPQIDVQGSYGLNGRGITGFSDTADNLTSAENPQWSVGVVVSIPLGNRRARADYFSAREQEQAAVLNLKRLEQDIVVEVGNITGQVRTNLKRIDATRAARRLAEEALRAEEEKLRSGDSTSLLVLQAQSQLAGARSAEIRAATDYSKSLVELARAEGTTLQREHIDLAEDSVSR